MTTDSGARVYTRQQFLTYQTIMDGTPMMMALEAVASTALAHPEWDMDEELTWAQWQQEQKQK